ncbi:hypothetical protein N825_28425 [Skermanella stibiiresistens SB22]|uniref:Uncharacterized protein n=1 Tax=Skermanella stibiiresistens SB22 TaxID=1385369 RepID=W9H9Z2_9PROT|nr:hypothetical protein [Skermanella stibiiresistens]EWY41532.1 hypothetical protein N825_28425 [Skermanella stibiiresistens SB22]
MSERQPVAPATIPLCGPADTLELIAGGSRATAREPDRCEWVFGAVHRGFGTWTHLYLVIESSRLGRSEIRLSLVLEGDRLDEARRRAVAGWWRPVD